MAPSSHSVSEIGNDLGGSMTTAKSVGGSVESTRLKTDFKRFRASE